MQCLDSRVASRRGCRLLARLAFVAVCLFFASSARAVREFVVIDEPQRAQRVEGVVLDPSGAPIAFMKVSDCSQKWEPVLRTTLTDRSGRFRLSRHPGKTVYYLRFDHPLWNPLGLTLKLDKKAPQRGITALPEVGG